MNREVLESIKHKQSRNIIIIGNLRVGGFKPWHNFGNHIYIMSSFYARLPRCQKFSICPPPPHPKEGIEISWEEERVSQTKQLKVVNADQ